MQYNKISVLLIGLLCLIACGKSDFLNKKPSTSIIVPQTLSEFQAMLDYSTMQSFGALAQLASDDYEVSFEDWQAATAIPRNSYIWAKDLYEGELEVQDWERPYAHVFYCNNVLEGLAKMETTPDVSAIKAQALFKRSIAFYELARNFCAAYDGQTASQDLGIPLKMSPNIDNIEQRSTMQETYDRILGDLKEAIPSLSSQRSTTNFFRPTRVAAYALLARIYLDMRFYTEAELYADSALQLYDVLIDYNTVDQSAASPFSNTHDEMIYNMSGSVISYSNFIGTGTTAAWVPEHIIDSYKPGDLRIPLFFTKNPDGTYKKRRGYYGSGHYPFTGLATDELYLIKAECLARKGEAQPAMDKLNQLLSYRFSNEQPYEPLVASTSDDALILVLEERRKELFWRCLRWTDLKRFNKEGANITLQRIVGSETYTLPPNDPRYVFPIPDSEILYSGIQQNIR